MSAFLNGNGSTGPGKKVGDELILEANLSAGIAAAIAQAHAQAALDGIVPRDGSEYEGEDAEDDGDEDGVIAGAALPGSGVAVEVEKDNLDEWVHQDDDDDDDGNDVEMRTEESLGRPAG